MPRKNVEALTDALGQLLSDPALRQRMGQASVEMTRREFGESSILDQWAALYKALGGGWVDAADPLAPKQ